MTSRDGTDGDARRASGGREGPPPQRLLLALLGDYWFERPEHLPSAALVELLGEFGVSPAAARAALSRLARKGTLESSRNGRHTGYGLSSRAPRVAARRRGARRIIAYALPSRPWDGHWRMVIFSVPEDRRGIRHEIRGRLRWLGFAPLYDGVWISPRDRADDAAQVLAELGVGHYTILTARTPPGVPQGTAPIEAWNLDDLRSRYDRFIATWEPVLARARRASIGAGEALRVRSELMYAWLRFPSHDPELPAELLPADWPRDRAYRVFTELYDSLGPLAETLVRRIVARHAPGLAPLVRHHDHRGTAPDGTGGPAGG